MRTRNCLLIFAAVCVTQAAFAQDEADRINLELSSENVEDAMSFLSQATGLNILLSSKVAGGKISAFIQEMVPLEALKQVVEVNGFRFVEEGDAFLVMTAEEFFEERQLGRERKVIRLEHARAADVASVLSEVVSPFGLVTAYPVGNLLVVAAEPDRLSAVDAIVAQLDLPRDTRVFSLDHAAATDMVALLQYHVTGPTVLQADVRTNQIVATDTEARLEIIERLLEELDHPDLVVTESFPLRYADATHVAEILREVLTGRRQSQGSGVVSGSASTQEPPQVFTARPTGATRADISSPFDRRSFARPSQTPAPPPPRIEIRESSTPALDAGATEDGEEGALGPLATVVADARTNSVVITHVAGVVERLRAIIDTLDIPNEFHTYQFQNANPADLDLETRLLPLLPAEDAYLNVDAISRTVTYRAGGDHAAQITALLEQWDDMVRQVSIEAEILSVNVSLVKDLGITWQAILRDAGEFLDRSIDAQATFPAAIAPGGSQGRLTVGNLQSDDYTAVIQALAQDSDTQVIASPVIMARDGSTGLFSTARDEPYTVVTVDGNTQTTLQDVRFLNVGINLSVTPTLSRHGIVTMDVVLEISDLVEIRDGNPVVDRSTAQSSIMIRDGGVTILGGLRESSRSKSVRGVPGLGKIPVLGSLFRSKRNDKFEREILLILRPTIQSDTKKEIPHMDTIYPSLKLDLKRRSLVEQRRE